MPNYVKFQRGSRTAYDSQLKLGQLNDDTLYFIYDKDDSYGSLYLGSRLISDIGSDTHINTLQQLQDVLVDEVPSVSDILIWTNNQKWENIPIDELAALIANEQSLGFTVNTSIFEFQESSTGTKKLNIIGFDAAVASSLAMKGNDGKLIWTDSPITQLNTKVSNLSDSFQALSNELNEKINNMGHLTYKKVASTSDIVDVNVVYLIQKKTADLNNSYDEYMLIDGKVERLGDWGVNLDGYITEETFSQVETKVIGLETKVPLLETKVANLETSTQSLKDSVSNLQGTIGDITTLTTYVENHPTTIVEQLNMINEKLTWQEM